MRRVLLSLVILATTAHAVPAHANAFTEWGASTGNTFLTGLNGIITAPADPVMCVVSPPATYDDVGAPVLNRFPFGFVHGIVVFAFRTSMGALDMVFAPLPMVTLSPEPRYSLLPGFEWEE